MSFRKNADVEQMVVLLHSHFRSLSVRFAFMCGSLLADKQIGACSLVSHRRLKLRLKRVSLSRHGHTKARHNNREPAWRAATLPMKSKIKA